MTQTQTPKQTAETSVSSIPRHDAELIAETGAFLADQGKKQTELAKMVGVSPSQLNAWLRQKYRGDVPGLEEKVRQAIRQHRASRGLVKEVIPTPMVNAVHGMAERLTRTGLIGLIYGAHGIGKTAGLIYHSLKAPNAIYFPVTKWSGNIAGVERGLMAFFSKYEWQVSGKCRGDFLTSKLVGSRRLLMVDGADNLTINARHWLLDLAEQTGGAILFACGPSNLATGDHQFVRGDKRLSSAVKLAFNPVFSEDDSRETATAILTAQFPQFPAWSEQLAGLVHAKGVGYAVAIAAIAADFVQHSRLAPDKALSQSATLCGVKLSQVPALM